MSSVFLLRMQTSGRSVVLFYDNEQLALSPNFFLVGGGLLIMLDYVVQNKDVF